MASAKLLPTELDFTSNGTDTNAKFTASASAFDFEGVAAADVDITGINNLTASGTVSADIVDATTDVQTPLLTVEDGANSTLITTQAAGAGVNFALPSNTGTNGQFLQTDGSGNLTFATITGLTFSIDAVTAEISSVITIASPGATIGGYTPNVGDPVLLLVQGGNITTPSVENGLWQWNGAATPMTRVVSLYAPGDDVANVVTFVDFGNEAGKSFIQIITPGIVDTDALEFSTFSGATPAAGNNTNVQYNSGGVFAGNDGFSYDGTSQITLGESSTSDGTIIMNNSVNAFSTILSVQTPTAGIVNFNLPPTNGTAGQYLQTDGTGNLSYVDAGAGAAAGVAGDVQFNDGSDNFAAATLSSYNFTDDAASPTLLVGVEAGTFNLKAVDSTGVGAASNITVASGDSAAANNAGVVTLKGGDSTGAGDAGSVNITAGQATGGGTFGSIVLQTGTSSATDNGFVFQNASSTSLVFVRGDSENATGVAPGAGQGTVHVTGGASFTETAYATDVNAVNTMIMDGSTSGKFAMRAAAVTTDYTITWPDAVAAGAGYVLKSDATGALSWEQETSALSWKDPVVAASTAPVPLVAPGATLDGVTLNPNDRILLKNGSVANPGTASVDNGIYIWTGAASPLVRSTDMPVGELSAGDAVISTGGTVNNDKAWVQTLTPGNVGTDPIEFVSFGAAGVGAAGTAGEVQINDPTTPGDFAAASTAYPETQYQYEATGPDAVLNVGNATSGATTAGSFTLQAGTAEAASGFAGSAVNINAGQGDGTADGGNITIAGGSSGTGATGDGGNVTIGGGAAVSTNGDGGGILLSGGAATGTGALGSLLVGNMGNISVVATENSTSTTTGTLRVVGGAGFTEDVYGNTFNAVSDVRMKKNISRIEDPLNKLMEIEGYSYDWKDEKLNRGKKQLGVLAQQLEKIGLDDVVTGTDDKKAVNYLALIPLMIEAIKEIANDVYE